MGSSRFASTHAASTRLAAPSSSRPSIPCSNGTTMPPCVSSFYKTYLPCGSQAFARAVGSNAAGPCKSCLRLDRFVSLIRHGGASTLLTRSGEARQVPPKLTPRSTNSTFENYFRASHQSQRALWKSIPYRGGTSPSLKR
ncbi:hypothetical protein CTRI78_v010433 [Colletotrichum trifolii]|uniref:Uncharacterized protein n=1 Tax=Colletotrichum trifolii TaxID=5466 RepID=A0A4V6QEM2_COLTR|nr:hypothetical protein CTRI78_v010433 [Colletotrichum trifolii]